MLIVYSSALGLFFVFILILWSFYSFIFDVQLFVFIKTYVRCSSYNLYTQLRVNFRFYFNIRVQGPFLDRGFQVPHFIGRSRFHIFLGVSCSTFYWAFQIPHFIGRSRFHILLGVPDSTFYWAFQFNFS